MREAALDLSSRDEVLVAAVRGDVDSTNADQLGARITDQLGNTHLGVALDITRVAYIDSAGTRMLFDLARHLSDHGQEMRLIAGEQTSTLRLLQIVGIEATAPLSESVDAAIADLRASRAHR